MILNKGDIGHHMYFISMGEVEVLPSVDESPLATLKEGDMFGEVCAFDPATSLLNVYLLSCLFLRRSTWFTVCPVEGW